MKKTTMVVFSGDLDKVLAGFVIANGAVSMGNEVTMFFTFWGLNALRKEAPQATGKGGDRAPESLSVAVPGQSQPVKIKVGQKVLINQPASERQVYPGQ